MDKSPNAFRTISEVSGDLDVPKHVLRFWESKFTQLKPMKRGGGRRYYRPEDIDLLRGIHCLLYENGYTIKGVQRILRESGVRYVKGCWQKKGAETAQAKPPRAIPDIAAETAAKAKGGAGRARSAASPQLPAGLPEKTVLLHLTPEQRQELAAILQELEHCRALLRAAAGRTPDAKPQDCEPRRLAEPAACGEV